MYCQNCGNQIPEDSQFCPECGNRVEHASKVTSMLPPQNETEKYEYIGFWERFGAHLIDGVILIVALIGFFILDTAILMLLWAPLSYYDATYVFAYLLWFLFVFLYYVYMESSSRQGTFGKNVLGIIVTDLDGNRISCGRATVRFIGRIIESISYGLLYLIIPFTAKKQGLHDFMAGTIVIRKKV